MTHVAVPSESGCLPEPIVESDLEGSGFRKEGLIAQRYRDQHHRMHSDGLSRMRGGNSTVDVSVCCRKTETNKRLDLHCHRVHLYISTQKARFKYDCSLLGSADGKTEKGQKFMILPMSLIMDHVDT